MHIYRISDDINGRRGYFHDEWDEWIETSVRSKFHEGYYESRLEREQRLIEEEQDRQLLEDV